MKGLRDVDPTQVPNDLVVLIAVIGWVGLFAYLVTLLIDWLSSITWFV
jgi:hypothetical protein